jgi:hypothetical protein
MSEVYGNAVANVAAADAKDGSFGLFVEQDVFRASRQYVQTSDGGDIRASGLAVI